MNGRPTLSNFACIFVTGALSHDPRAHTVLCEAIAFNGAPNLMVALHELRARVRGVLGLWVEAGEDIRLALKGLEQTEDFVSIDSDEERMEASGGPPSSTMVVENSKTEASQ